MLSSWRAAGVSSDAKEEQAVNDLHVKDWMTRRVITRLTTTHKIGGLPVVNNTGDRRVT